VKILFLLASAAAVGSCASCGTGAAEDPEPVVIVADGKELCALACDRMSTELTNKDGLFGCEEAAPTPAPPDVVSCEGPECPTLVRCDSDSMKNECMSCTWFCEYAHDQGSYWNTECIVYEISTCAQIEDVCNQ
jgi:hypothetical protein